MSPLSSLLPLLSFSPFLRFVELSFLQLVAAQPNSVTSSIISAVVFSITIPCFLLGFFTIFASNLFLFFKNCRYYCWPHFVVCLFVEKKIHFMVCLPIQCLFVSILYLSWNFSASIGIRSQFSKHISPTGPTLIPWVYTLDLFL